MTRIVPTGDLGLDLLLGGGWRLVSRLPGRASATVLLRGGAGTGKTLLGIQVALSLAEALSGDVAVGCVEILPTEYLAQLQAARPGLESTRVVLLPASGQAHTTQGPRVFCGLLTDLEPSAPDLVASLECLDRAVRASGGSPRVFIIDSLSEGYRIGSSIRRTSADAVMKFAAQMGYGLVLCEETSGDTSPSPWVFASDTVIELGVEVDHEGRRWIEVEKHRFGPSAPGRHDLELVGKEHPEVYPDITAWVSASKNLLRDLGWGFMNRSPFEPVRLQWHEWLSRDRPEFKKEAGVGELVLVTSSEAGLARTLALTILPRLSNATGDFVVELSPLLRDETAYLVGPKDAGYLSYLPTILGPARALRALVRSFSAVFVGEQGERHSTVRRVIIGDLGIVLADSAGLSWANAIRLFATLVAETGWRIPVIAYGSGPLTAPSAWSLLAAFADVRVNAIRLDAPQPGNTGQVLVDVTQRASRERRILVAHSRLDAQPLPDELSRFDHQPSPNQVAGRRQ